MRFRHCRATVIVRSCIQPSGKTCWFALNHGTLCKSRGCCLGFYKLTTSSMVNTTVTKRDGSRVPFNAEEINKSIAHACQGLSDPIAMAVQIATETQLMLYDGITTEELDQATISAALQNIQNDPEYDIAAKRLLLKTLYKRVLGPYGQDEAELKERYSLSFEGHIKNAVAEKLLDTQMEERFDLTELSKTIKTERDHLFDYAGLSTLLDRYAMKGKHGKAVELPQYFFMRVAMGLSYNEKDPTAQAKKFYEKMSQLEYLAGGSTNIGAGTTRPALSNCFLLEIHDDIDHIAKSVSDVIKISKATGGIGTSITKLRASGSPLSSNNTNSSGPTPFAKIIDTSIRAIQRGGKKKGALCFYMENWHVDFPDFVEWRHNAGDDYLRMRTANTAVFISDEFMRRVENEEDWYMFDPKETADLNELYGKEFAERYAHYIEKAEAGELRVFKKVPAREQYKQILVALETTSHPWLTWKDAINVRALNNNTGTIHMSNLCTEICLPQDKDNIAVCNLASLNIAQHIENEQVDWDRLAETVATAIRHLDNLIDINDLPIEEARRSDQANRAVGLGMMGFADACEKMRFSYESEEAYTFSDQIFEFISFHAINTSTELAQERGSYENYQGSEWSKGLVPVDTIARLNKQRGNENVAHNSAFSDRILDWDMLREKVKKGMRNATLLAVAPNANIGLVAGTTPGIDPRFSQVFARAKNSGKYMDINHNLVDELKERGIWEQTRGEIIQRRGDISEIREIPEDIKERYKSAFTTSPYAFVEVAARAQKWVDQALSRNMYLATRDIDEVMDIYTTAWKRGLKTTYYLHMKPRHSAEQSTIKVNKGSEIGKVGFAALKKSAPAAASTPAPKEEALTAEASAPKKDPVAVAEKKESAFTCPVDPQERLVCDSCQ